MRAEDRQPDAAADLEFIEELSSADRVLVVQGSADPEQFLMTLAEEAAGLAVVNADRALEASQLVKELADDIRVPLAQARARRSWARALSYTGRFDDALHACREALDYADQAGRLDEAGRIRLASMHPLLETGRLDEAVQAGESARKLFLRIDAPHLAARADLNLGAVYQRRDQPSTAVACFDRARPALADEPLTLGHLENNCGEALLALNDFAGAEAAFRAALTAFEGAGAELTAAIAAGNLADLAVRQGQPAVALAYFERARRRLESTQSPAHIARLIAEQADVKAMLGLHADALSDYESSIADLDQCGLALESARARAGMGRVLFLLRRFAESETALAAAATGFDELGHATARAKVDLIRAEVAAFNGRLPEARGMAWRALAVLDQRPADAVSARHLLARFAMQVGDLELAEAELGAAMSTARSFDIAPLLADLLHTRGTLHRLAGRTHEACADFEQAVHNVERIRLSLQADRFRAAFLGNRSVLYEDLVASLLDSPDQDSVARAYHAAEQCKSRTLLDQLQTLTGDREAPAIDDQPDADDTLRNEHHRIRSELNALYSRLADEPESAGGTQLDGWASAVQTLERSLDTIESRLAATNHADVFAGPDDLPGVQQRLRAGECLLEYFVTHGRLHLFQITREHAIAHIDIAPIHAVVECLQRIHFQIDRGLRPDASQPRRATRRLAQMQAELRDMYHLLLHPVAEHLDTFQTLIIVPHGALHLIPFHALYDGDQYLIERVEMVNAISGSLLRSAGWQAPDQMQGNRTVVVGVADEVAPSIEHEARSVARRLGTRDEDLLIGAQATADAVRHAAQNADLLHIAAHGRFRADRPLQSGLRLHDRWFTVRDLLSLRLKSRLVTLSGCETGLNCVEAGDELVGLLRGFHAAGAQAVLTSLWQVGDDATLEHMRHFYRHWDFESRTPCSPAAALRQAQIDLMKQHPHPAQWAPFTLIGGN